MATRTYLDILLEVKETLRINRDQHLAMSVLDDAFRWFWDIEPWQETLADMTPFYLVPGWNIYREPLIEKPSNFRDLYSASIVYINDQGVQTEKPMEVIGNIVPNSMNYFGGVMGIGYNHDYQAFVLDSIPSGVVGQTYIRPKYKKDYPVDLTASNAAENAFPFKRHEGAFKVVLGWFIRNRNKEDAVVVREAIASALRSEQPGKQPMTQPTAGQFSNLGLY